MGPYLKILPSIVILLIRITFAENRIWKQLLPVAEANQARILYPAMRALRILFVMLAKTRVIGKLDHLHIHLAY